MSHKWDCLDFFYLLVAHRNTQFADPESSVSSVTDLHHKVSFSLQRVCCMETKASCSRKSEKQHSKQGWSSKPTALLPRAPERAAQKYPPTRNNLRLPLTVTGALYQSNPLHPLGNERQCRTRCQETRFCLVGLSEEAE